MAVGTYRTTLSKPGLRPFLSTQFLGAFNDNVFKIVVTFLAIRAYGPAMGPALVAVAFIVPFMLFSGYAGHWADVTSKPSDDRITAEPFPWPWRRLTTDGSSRSATAITVRE